jgi:hypothetical protein
MPETPHRPTTSGSGRPRGRRRSTSGGRTTEARTTDAVTPTTDIETPTTDVETPTTEARIAEPGSGSTGRRATHPLATDPRSTTELVNDLLELVPRLIREELALATAEMREKGRRAGVGAGLFTGGGVLALYGGGALVAAAALGLARAVPDWLAVLIIGVVLLAVAGVVALIAKRQVAQAVPPAPQRTMENVREDVATVKDAVAGERTSTRTS